MSFCRIDNKPIRTHEPVTEPDALERFLGDEALRKGWQVPVDAAPTGKRVLVVGAGPSGLSAAYHLARLGHWVTIKDVGAAHAPASFGALNTWYYADAAATVRPRLEAARRITTFDEATGGLDESTALFEARRCMSCGLCAAECPCGAIEMEPEPS